ncbi:hypothetical protein SLEP1_g27885 [Rubroshorea leprosula]|uniref:Uncharacterized protein n=1 Tax=Rubroshorea leprosula TaxID=152421 RepID=A0AAV5K3A1_9ROSI|nr:hypothetical protein SLEP1_g27885 [Rubroshorea leprosula]
MASISISIPKTCFACFRAQMHSPRRGGNVYVEVDAAMNSLLPFWNGVHFRAGRGGHGQERGHGGEGGAQDCDQRGREGRRSCWRCCILDRGHCYFLVGEVAEGTPHLSLASIRSPGWLSMAKMVRKCGWNWISAKAGCHVCMVGAPSAGKSTLLGVVSFDYDSTMVIHVVDGYPQQPESVFDAVCLKLEMFSPELVKKPYIVAYNKMDLPEA